MDPVTIPSSRETLSSLWKIQKIILETLDFDQVVQKIVDSIAIELGYLNLGYRIVVLALADESAQVLRRVSMSQTPAAEATMSAGNFTFDQIVIPFSATANLCIQTYLDRKPRTTHDWQDILTPPIPSDEARRLQQVSGVANSLLLPVIENQQCIGVMIFSLAKDVSEMSEDEKNLIQSFTEIVSLAIHDARLYSKLQETTDRLDQANKKLQELDHLKDDFISVTSHELRSPMTAIKSYTWLVLNNKAGPLEPKAHDYLDKVYQSTERLIHLVNEMLDISRIESGRVQLHPELFDMRQLAEAVKDEFSAKAAEQSLTLEVTAPADLPQLTADREKLHQVLENLVSNAIKFTPAGGRITISLVQKDQSLETSVTDTGPGISAEDQKKLFVKFGRLENTLIARTGTGTGLGLYICKQYVELHKGQIWFTSELGHGSTFTFSLPLS